MRSLAALVAALAPLACSLPVDVGQPAPVVVSDGRYAMGTLFEVTLVHRDETVAQETLSEIFAEVERLDALLSVWNPESDITRLNTTARQPRVFKYSRVTS